MPYYCEIIDFVESKVQSTLKSICKAHSLRLVYLFGSRQHEGEEYLQTGAAPRSLKGSDLDVAVLIEKDENLEAIPQIYKDIYAELVKIFEPFDPDLVILNEMDPLFQYNVIGGICVYAESQKIRRTHAAFMAEYSSRTRSPFGADRRWAPRGGSSEQRPACLPEWTPLARDPMTWASKSGHIMVRTPLRWKPRHDFVMTGWPRAVSGDLSSVEREKTDPFK